jgi:flagellar motor switch protein FliM
MSASPHACNNSEKEQNIVTRLYQQFVEPVLTAYKELVSIHKAPEQSKKDSEKKHKKPQIVASKHLDQKTGQKSPTIESTSPRSPLSPRMDSRRSHLPPIHKNVKNTSVIREDEESNKGSI